MSLKSRGSVGDMASAGICILAMAVLMQSYMVHMSLVQKRMAVGALARKYILRMETVGYLTEEDRHALVAGLEEMEISRIDLEGTTMYRVEYGTPIYLCVKGVITEKSIWTGGAYLQNTLEEKEFAFEERCMSTAKN